jgi:hypothetical protein
MVGGTRIHRWIHGASLGQEEGRQRILVKKNESLATHALDVYLDRADNVIEGAPSFAGFANGGGFASLPVFPS